MLNKSPAAEPCKCVLVETLLLRFEAGFCVSVSCWGFGDVGVQKAVLQIFYFWSLAGFSAFD